MVWLLCLLGLLTGAFVNLCADSLPVNGRLSQAVCPYCGRPRPLAACSALVTFLFGRQRCPACAAPISVRHLVVELASALLFAFTWLRTGTTWTTLFNALYSAILILVMVTDLEHRVILHAVTLPAILLALLGAFLNPAWASPKRALLGGAIGLVVTFGVYLLGAAFARLMGRIRGQPISEVAFGFGDVTLNTFIGLIVRAPEIIFAMVMGFLLGGIAALLILVVQGLLRRQYKPFTAFPYGPFLILGGMTMLYYGPQFMDWYLHR
jgi:leader peptidase (prepilin peptidase)/N-methyltransferase